MAEIESPDCGDNSCLYVMPHQRGGLRTNGGCRCDRGEGMQVHSQDPATRPGWYWTRKAMHLGRLGMAARDQRIAALETALAELVKDRERWDFVEQNSVSVVFVSVRCSEDDWDEVAAVQFAENEEPKHHSRKARQALDSAMEGE